MAGAVVLRNEVALPFPGSSSGSIIKGLTQIAGTIVATSLVVDAAHKNRVKEGTIIYRSSAYNEYQLTPRPVIDENGLSFFTYIMAKNNKAVMTTVEAVKKEGVFLIETDPKHYLISAKDPYEHQLWMNSKSNANNDPYYLTEILMKISVPVQVQK